MDRVDVGMSPRIYFSKNIISVLSRVHKSGGNFKGAEFVEAHARVTVPTATPGKGMNERQYLISCQENEGAGEEEREQTWMPWLWRLMWKVDSKSGNVFGWGRFGHGIPPDFLKGVFDSNKQHFL